MCVLVCCCRAGDRSGVGCVCAHTLTQLTTESQLCTCTRSYRDHRELARLLCFVSSAADAAADAAADVVVACCAA